MPKSDTEDALTAHERRLRAWHMYPAEAHDILSLRRFLAYFRAMESSGIYGPQTAEQMRDFQRSAETAINRHDDATEADRADCRLL